MRPMHWSESRVKGSDRDRAISNDLFQTSYLRSESPHAAAAIGAAAGTFAVYRRCSLRSPLQGPGTDRAAASRTITARHYPVNELAMMFHSGARSALAAAGVGTWPKECQACEQ